MEIQSTQATEAAKPAETAAQPQQTAPETTNTAPETTNTAPKAPEIAQNTAENSPKEASFGEPAVIQPEWKPSFKFKHLGKELEVDELFKGVIKDADTEKKVHELFQKSLGLDDLKPKHQAKIQELEQLQSVHKPIVKELQQLGQDIQAKNFDKVFGALKIPEADLYQWVLDKIKFQELPQEQKQAILEQRQAQEKAMTFEQRSQMLEQQLVQTQVHARSVQLDTALSQPSIQSIAQQFDAARGAGAFRQAVIEVGSSAAQLQGVDLTPEQAIQKLLSYTLPGGAGAQPMGQAAAPQMQQQKPQVIPNIAAGSARSPVKKSPKSLDELRQRAREIGAGT